MIQHNYQVRAFIHCSKSQDSTYIAILGLGDERMDWCCFVLCEERMGISGSYNCIIILIY